MKIIVKRLVNQGTTLEVEVEDRSDKEALAKALFIAQPDRCNSNDANGNYCGNEKIIWSSNKSKDDKGNSYTYIKRYCPKCQSSSTAGEYQTGGLFWKKFEVYKREDGQAPAHE